MTIREFEKETAAVIRALPAFVKERLGNVAVVVRAGRSRDGILGLYEGVPWPQKEQACSGAMPDKITLFKDSIEAQARGKAAVKTEIRNVLLHEIAHHFGMSDAELRKKGLY